MRNAVQAAALCGSTIAVQIIRADREGTVLTAIKA